MNLDRAIEAAAEALLDDSDIERTDTCRQAARIAVEAAAPLIRENWGNVVWELLRAAEIRAERAEALADRLAEALRNCLHWSNEDGNAALDAWKEARSES